MNPLDYDPTYPRNPATLAEYIRKLRKDKGLCGHDLTERLGVAEISIIKWEGGRMPTVKSLRERLREGIPGTQKWLEEAHSPSHSGSPD